MSRARFGPCVIGLFLVCRVDGATITTECKSEEVLGTELNNTAGSPGILPISEAGWSAIGSGLMLYNSLGDLRGTYKVVQFWLSSTKHTLTSNLMRNFDALLELHQVLVKKLDLEPADWRQLPTLTKSSADNRAKIDNFFKIKHQWGSYGVVGMAMHGAAAIASNLAGSGASANISELACEMDLKVAVAYMRQEMIALDAENEQLLESLKTTQIAAGERLPFQLLPDRGCDPIPLADGVTLTPETEAVNSEMRQHLEFHDAIELAESETFSASGDTGLCLELPATPDWTPEQVIEACEGKCREMDQCDGFTLYNGTLIHHHAERSELNASELSDEARYGWHLLSAENDGAVVEPIEGTAIFKDGWFERHCNTLQVMLDWERSRGCDPDEYALFCGDKIVPAPKNTNGNCFEYQSFKVTMLPDRKEELRNRCCFRSSVEQQYTQEATSCFVRPRAAEVDELRKMDADATAAWFLTLPLESPGRETAAEQIRTSRLNGLALESLGKAKIGQYLGYETDEHQNMVRCMIDATMQRSSQEKCTNKAFLDTYDAYHDWIDPKMFWGVKTIASGLPTAWSWSFFLGRLSGLLDMAKGKLKQYRWIDNMVDGFKTAASAYISYDYTVGYAETVGKQNWLAGEVDPLPTIAAVSYLIHDFAENAMDQCFMIKNWLEKTDAGNPSNVNKITNQIKNPVIEPVD